MAQASATSFSWLPGAFGAANAGLEVLKLENIEFKDILFSHSATADDGSNAPVESYKGGWRDGQVLYMLYSCKISLDIISFYLF